MANISAIKLPNNTTYNIKDNVSGYTTSENITQEEYDALTPAQKSDDIIYFIYDGTPTPGPTPVSNLQNLVDGSATGSVRGIGTTAESGSYTMGTYAFAEGYVTTASGNYSHTEGCETAAIGWYSHAEGDRAIASGFCSHAEGLGTVASGYYSHAEDRETTASGNGSHAEGINTTASGDYSHAQNTYTIAQRKSQTALGEYNIADTTGETTARGEYVVIVGNGTANNARSNALTVDWSGNTSQQGHATTKDMTSQEVSDFVNSLTPSGISLVDFFYPVGSYYETSDTLFNPNVAWGGTWVLETEGQVHVSAGANYTVSGALTNTSDDGEVTHTLVANELPNVTGSLLFRRWGSTGDGYIASQATGAFSSTAVTSSAQGIPSTGQNPNSMQKITLSFGSGDAHNNMQPYIIVNRWHRTA